MKRLISILLALFMAATLFAACGGGGAATTTAAPAATTAATTAAPAATTAAPTTTTTADAGPAPVEIRAAWWGDTWRHELYNSIVDLYVEAFPHVTVVREPVSWGDYWEKMAIQVAGGNATDFMCMHPFYAADYAPRGVMEPLQPYVDDGTISISGWDETALKSGILKGELYMMAMGLTVYSTFVNLTMFDELGIDPPPFEFSWDEMVEMAREFRTAAQELDMNNWFCGDGAGNYQFLRAYVRQLGHEFYDSDGNLQVTVEEAEFWFNYWKNLRDQDLIVDTETGAEFAGATLEDSLFSRDRMAVNLMPPVNQITLFTNTFPDKEITVVRNPVTPGGLAGEVPEGAHYAVYANTTADKKLAAAQLINFWLNTPESLKLYKLDQGVPANLSLKSAYLDELLPPQVINLDFVEKISLLDKIPGIWPPAGNAAIEDLLRLKAEEVSYNMKSPGQAAKEFVEETAAIRAKAIE